MSIENLDDLLKSNLENFKQKAPQGAWSRIEQSKSKKPMGNWKIILSVAASLITVLVISFVLITNDQEREPVLAESEVLNTPDQKQNPVQEPVENNQVKSPAPVEDSENTKSAESVTEQRTEERPPQTETFKTPEVKNQVAENVDQRGVEKVEEINDNENKPIDPQDSKDFVAQNTPIETPQNEEISIDTLQVEPIVPALEPLQSENTIAEAEVPEIDEEEKTERGISFKKILEMAKDLKTDNNAWSSLREAKNEFLTFGRNKNDESE